MGSAILFCVVVCLIQASMQYSIGELNPDTMVSDAWSDDILTDVWNGVPRGCGSKPADIYFVLDTSSGASPAALAAQKQYLNDLAALFPLQNGRARVGVVTFGHAPFITAPLGKAPTLSSVQTALKDSPVVGGSRRTAQALKYIRQIGFSPVVARTHVAQVVILLTNGYSADAKQTALEASALRKQGVIVYTVSVSTSGHVDKGELLEIASRPSEAFVFSSDGWEIVESLIEMLQIEECNYQVLPPLPGKEPVCVSRRPTELAFAVEHLGLGSPKTQKIISFIQDMLAEVDPNSDIQAAILTSKDPIAHYAVSLHVDTIQLLEKKLGGLVFPDVSQLLRRARRVLTRGAADKTPEITDNTTANKKTPKQTFRDVQKVLLVFMDDSVRITKKTLAAARANRHSKVDTYVVYVGQEGQNEEKKGYGLDMREVEMVASGKDYVIKVPSYDHLRTQETVVDTLKNVCRGL